MRTVHEVSKLTGVSVRTLHHYDAIGLLKPTRVTDAGYRLYDDAAIGRLQTILLFRELQFPLKEIKTIIERPGFDQKKALEQQIELLELHRKRLGELIAFAREMLMTGGGKMDFPVFDRTELNQYEAEVKSRWGETPAYQEYQRKSGDQTGAERRAADEGLLRIFAEVGKGKGLTPDSAEAQAAVEELRQWITEHYYNCTPQILSSLGQMYVGDERMKAGIDNAGGGGTAEFVSKAIEIYCGNCQA